MLYWWRENVKSNSGLLNLASVILSVGVFETGGVGVAAVTVSDESGQLYLAFHREENVDERTSRC